MALASASRAVNWNAFSGSSSLGSAACPSHGTISSRVNKKRIGRVFRVGMRLAYGQGGLRRYPFQVLGEAAHQWDSDDFGKFVGMMPADRRFDFSVERSAGLDQQRHLLRGFYRF